MIQYVSQEEGLQPALLAPPPRALVVGRLAIVEQLLGNLETATHGGRGYVMAKIVGLLRDETAQRGLRLSELQRRSIKRVLDELDLEPERMLPDPIAFVARAHTIADVLSIC